MLTAPDEIQKVYLSGPMSGIENFNFPAFNQAATDLRDRGFEVFNPAECDEPSDDQDYVHGSITEDRWAEYLTRDISMILAGKFQAIVVLPGWENSRGSRMEVFAGETVRLPIIDYSTGRELGGEFRFVELEMQD